MRYLIPTLMLFLIGCEGDPAMETSRPDASFSKVPAALVLDEAPNVDGTRTASEDDALDAEETPVPRGSGSGTLPSQSMTAYPHTPGLSHVSVFSVYLTDTEVVAKDQP